MALNFIKDLETDCYRFFFLNNGKIGYCDASQDLEYLWALLICGLYYNTRQYGRTSSKQTT